jgi:hypothetical protein
MHSLSTSADLGLTSLLEVVSQFLGIRAVDRMTPTSRSKTGQTRCNGREYSLLAGARDASKFNATSRSGVNQNSQRCDRASASTNNVGAVLRAGFTDLLVTGMETMG